ncbi:MAG: undecaprenyldiphospho-muramoylpentapeptide beta-N-acetylglucosaminyltransferase [Rubrivivax sp.]|jgi:UDP-N-acetylglucosamine--N-acetylmuramyl-(pentapeptide) pyrophosphoryl-undecaprenol N-acetylglucosamine transferase|nr:undecaprenyldiphospho-muramoylpentapeptide beta-N-acetylglucosaminyltransferase [Rubrivivax sp.]
MKRLVVMAAGTGGHIIPGLAVAREMQRRGWSVSWLGTRHGMENRLVPPQAQSGIVLDTIAFDGVRGKGLVHTLTGGLRLLKAMWDSLRVLRRRSADVVLGMGGYVCFPGGLMASLLGKPLMLVNADAALLLSNRSLMPVADKVAFGFEGEAASRTRQGVVTGNPVRLEIEQLPPPPERWATRRGPLRLLVVGGSLGAQVLNETLPHALALVEPELRPIVVHQTGERNLAAVQAGYQRAGFSEGEQLQLRAFIDDMPEQLAACDLIICRAGAITISELCAAGVPAILVPLVISTTSHQRDNAQWMAGHEAAFHVPQAELTPQRLAELLRSVHRVGLLAMAIRARNLARPYAAQRVADELERLAGVR